jgi:hypothetical protein
MSLFDDKTLAKFPVLEGLSAMPVEKCEERWCRMPAHLRAHATSLDNLEYILGEGIQPGGGKYGCPVWDSDVMPSRFKDTEREETILKCREDGVFFWDDYHAGTEQALTTVAHRGEGEPVLLITDVGGLKLELDPEMHDPEDEADEFFGTMDPVATFHRGEIPTERIRCLCALKDDYQMSTGSVLCAASNDPSKPCSLHLDDGGAYLWEELSDIDAWECFCKRPMK